MRVALSIALAVLGLQAAAAATTPGGTKAVAGTKLSDLASTKAAATSASPKTAAPSSAKTPSSASPSLSTSSLPPSSSRTSVPPSSPTAIATSSPSLSSPSTATSSTKPSSVASSTPTSHSSSPSSKPTSSSKTPVPSSKTPASPTKPIASSTQPPSSPSNPPATSQSHVASSTNNTPAPPVTSTNGTAPTAPAANTTISGTNSTILNTTALPTSDPVPSADPSSASTPGTQGGPSSASTGSPSPLAESSNSHQSLLDNHAASAAVFTIIALVGIAALTIGSIFLWRRFRTRSSRASVSDSSERRGFGRAPSSASSHRGPQSSVASTREEMHYTRARAASTLARLGAGAGAEYPVHRAIWPDILPAQNAPQRTQYTLYPDMLPPHAEEPAPHSIVPDAPPAMFAPAPPAAYRPQPAYRAPSPESEYDQDSMYSGIRQPVRVAPPMMAQRPGPGRTDLATVPDGYAM